MRQPTLAKVERQNELGNGNHAHVGDIDFKGTFASFRTPLLAIAFCNRDVQEARCRLYPNHSRRSRPRLRSQAVREIRKPGYADVHGPIRRQFRNRSDRNENVCQCHK